MADTINPANKSMVADALKAQNISLDSAEAKQILAMGMIEGHLDLKSNDSSKSGASKNLTPFNLNQGMVDTLKQKGLLPKGVESQLSSGDLKEQIGGAVQVMDAYFKMAGGDGLARATRTGSATGDQGFSEYDAALKDATGKINASTWTDDARIAKPVAYQ